MNSEQSHLGATPDSRPHPMTLRRQNKRCEKIFYVKMAESFILLAFFIPPPLLLKRINFLIFEMF